MVQWATEGTDDCEEEVLLKVVGSGPAGFPRIGQLVAKAAAIRGLMYWVENECKLDLAAEKRTAGPPAIRAAGTPATPAELMAAKRIRLKSMQHNCIYGFCEADRICRRAGRYFTEEEHAEFCGWLEVGLTSYNALAAEALASNMKLYKLIPKFHALTHYYDTRLNPRRATCYQDEDMVGRMKKIYVNTHGSTAPKRALERYHVVIGIRWNDVMAQLRGISL